MTCQNALSLHKEFFYDFSLRFANGTLLIFWWSAAEARASHNSKMMTRRSVKTQFYFIITSSSSSSYCYWLRENSINHQEKESIIEAVVNEVS